MSVSQLPGRVSCTCGRQNLSGSQGRGRAQQRRHDEEQGDVEIPVSLLSAVLVLFCLTNCGTKHGNQYIAHTAASLMAGHEEGSEKTKLRRIWFELHAFRFDLSENPLPRVSVFLTFENAPQGTAIAGGTRCMGCVSVDVADGRD